MKKVLLTLLGIIVVAGILAGAGFAGYRIGYNHGALAATSKSAGAPQPQGFDIQRMPMHGFGNDFGMQGMPRHGFDNGFHQGFGRNQMMGRGHGGFGFFGSLLHLAVLAALAWVAYKLIKGSGWTLTRQAVPAPAPVAEAPQAESKPE